MSPESRGTLNFGGESAQHSPKTQGLGFEADGVEPVPDHADAVTSDEGAPVKGGIAEPHDAEIDARDRLLEDYHKTGACGSADCNHGTFSPHLYSSASSVNSANGFGGRWPGGMNEEGGARDSTHELFGDTVADGILGDRSHTMSTTKWLAQKHGIKNSTAM
ncbi:MAG: hypothetical protein Q9227_009240 [Pyrenula ochraceoflavens]